jgi:hypothetical protein
MYDSDRTRSQVNEAITMEGFPQWSHAPNRRRTDSIANGPGLMNGAHWSALSPYHVPQWRLRGSRMGRPLVSTF